MEMATNSLLTTWSLAIAILVDTIICLRCYTSPNPPPQSYRLQRDTLMNTYKGRFSFTFNRIAVLLLGPAHTYLILNPPTHGTISAFCPHPELVNPNALRWTLFNTSCLSLIFVFGTIRLLAYRQLGHDFTYELAPPRKLVTTGLYRYVRNPSYTAKVLVALPLGLFFLRDDGAAGCWLPALAVRYRLFSLSVWMTKTVIALSLKESRVREEEQMMEKEFGEEWRNYVARTTRYIPFVF
jgi:protein-S-isoprenylcysteine O-methyltransferase Ste14